MTIRTRLAGLCSGLLMAAAVVAEEQVATLKTVQGKVTVLRGQTGARASTGAPLFAGDLVTTSRDSATGISFLDGTRMSLGPDSELRIDRFLFDPLAKSFGFEMFLRKGSAAYTSGKFGKLAPEAVKVRTYQATVGIRGTRFLIRAE